MDERRGHTRDLHSPRPARKTETGEASGATVGWCSQVKCYAGAADANYDTDYSAVPEATDRFGGISFEPSIIRDTLSVGYQSTLHFPQPSFPQKIRWINEKYVILWDVSDKRAWLVNGASALMHLVRASFKYSNHQHRYIEEAETSHTTQSAAEVLLNPQNRQVKINHREVDVIGETIQPPSSGSGEDIETIHFFHAVEYYCSVLESLVNLQAKISVRKLARGLPSPAVEGWDFKEIVLHRRQVRPRSMAITNSANDWAGFARSINAVILFGRGFGDIIQPADNSPYLKWLPKEKHYLAACNSDLRDIMKLYGDQNRKPPRLTGTIVWHISSDSVQTLHNRSPSLRRLLPSKTSLSIDDLPHIGAVIFGQNSKINWPLKDTGDNDQSKHGVATPANSSPDTRTSPQDPVDAVPEKGRDRSVVAPVGPTPSIYEGCVIGAETTDAIFEILLDIYRRDPVLLPLQQKIREIVHREVAVANLNNLIDGYCVLLRSQFLTYIQLRAVQFLRRHSKRFAEQIYERKNSSIGQVPLGADTATEAETEIKQHRTAEYVEQLIPGQSELKSPSFPSLANAPPTTKGDDADRELSTDDLLSHISEIKRFLVESEPMQDLRIAFKNFVEGNSMADWDAKVRRVQQASHGPTPAEPTPAHAIRERIMGSLTSDSAVSRENLVQSYKVNFAVDWDIMSFMKEQQYDWEQGEDNEVGKAITLTGSERDAQALSCSQYMTQIWPLSGSQVVDLVKDVVCNVEKQCACRLPDGTTIKAWIDGPIFAFEANGPDISVAEIGVQIAWLGAALRSSPYELGVACCTPQIQLDIPSSKAPEDPHRPFSFRFKIDFAIEKPDLAHRSLETPNGYCWHNMFRNPIIVKGYPIPPKPEPFLGIEIPFDMMASLVQTKRLNTFDGKLFLKGFSSMLIPTKRVNNLIIWHLIYHSDGTRISYLESSVDHAEGIAVSDRAETRHVVGWCTNVRMNAGSSQHVYEVGKSSLPKPFAGCILEKVNISGGKYITIGATFALGCRDKPLYIPQARETYLQKLNWISDKYFVFWDELDHRGWLVNGTCTILHLLRASLEHDKTSKIADALLFKAEQMKEPLERHKPESAMKVLLSEENQLLQIWPNQPEYSEQWTQEQTVPTAEPGKANNGASPSPEWKFKRTVSRTYYTVANRVDDLYNVLEQMLDDQAKITTRAGVELKVHGRKHLEGWAFKDVASRKPDLWPHVAKLPAIGKGWVDFARDIQAVTLFGSKFGEIIQPSTTFSCGQWRVLPRNKYYLAACISDLKSIMANDEFGGDATSIPPKLTKNIVWHTPNKIFAACQCQNVPPESKHSDLIQVLLPAAYSKHQRFQAAMRPWYLNLLAEKNEPLSENDLACQGAVVFGHNYQFNWHYKDTGEPVQGVPPLEEPDNDSHNEVYKSASPETENGGLASSNSQSIRASIGREEPETIASTPATSAQDDSPAVLTEEGGTEDLHSSRGRRFRDKVVFRISKLFTGSAIPENGT